MEKSNLPDAEFKTLVIRMLNVVNENFYQEIGNIKMEVENIRKKN